MHTRDLGPLVLWAFAGHFRRGNVERLLLTLPSVEYLRTTQLGMLATGTLLLLADEY